MMRLLCVFLQTLPPTEHKRQKVSVLAYVADSNGYYRGLLCDTLPWQVLQSLMETESTFHSVLQNGIETYMEPLRSVLSGPIHSKLFYNLKEVRVQTGCGVTLTVMCVVCCHDYP